MKRNLALGRAGLVVVVLVVLLTMPLWLPLWRNSRYEVSARVPQWPVALTPGVSAPPTGPPPLLVGLYALTDEFVISRELRLEIPLAGKEAQIAALVAQRKGNTLEGMGSLEYWTLDPLAVEPYLNTRVNQLFDLTSPTISYHAPLLSYELWHDTTCGNYLLCAVFPLPGDEVVEEPMLWVGAARPLPMAHEALDDSFAFSQPAEPPAAFVGTYESIAHLVQAAAAADALPGELPPQPMMDVRFGRFLPEAGTSTLVLGTWITPEARTNRLLILLDPQGQEVLRLGGQALGTAAPILALEYMVDLQHDGIDEIVVRTTTMDGAEQVQIWSFAGGSLQTLQTGSWWGCSAGVPSGTSTLQYGNSA